MVIKNIFVLFVSLFLTVTLVSCADGEEKANKHFKRAMEFAQKEDYKKALSEFIKAAEFDDDQPKIYYNMAVTYTYIDARSKDGEKAFNRAIELSMVGGEGLRSRFVPFSYYGLASIYSLRGENERALDYLETAIKEGFQDHRLLMRDKELDNIRDEPRFKKLVKATWKIDIP